MRRRRNVSTENSADSNESQPKKEAQTETLSFIATYKTPIILFLVSVITRFWRIDQPAGVVFDEFHFGKFVNQYSTGAYFFDIHPPLGKLTLWAVGWVFGYRYDVCKYEHIHQVFDPECNYLILRYTAAVFGTLLPPLTYFIARELGVSGPGAVLAASLVIFDMLNLIESRLILTDSQLMFYSALTLYIALRMWRIMNRDANRGRRTPKIMTRAVENKWCFAMGMATGAAVSIKWTALATPALVAVESVFGLFFLKRVAPARMIFKVILVALAQYTLWFAIHFHLLPNTGDGDLFMPLEFQRTLINSTVYDPDAQPVSFWYIFPELNREMLDANARIDVVHSWASRYHQWVLNARGVLYYTQKYSRKSIAQVYLMGNPIALWLCLAGIIIFIGIGFAYLRCRNARAKLEERMDPQLGAVAMSRTMCVGAYCLVNFFLNLLPYIAVTRSAFCYHYMPGLFYAELLLAVVADRLCRPYHRACVFVVLVAVVVGFLYWSPWVYALPLTPDGHRARRWLKSWN